MRGVALGSRWRLAAQPPPGPYVPSTCHPLHWQLLSRPRPPTSGGSAAVRKEGLRGSLTLKNRMSGWPFRTASSPPTASTCGNGCNHQPKAHCDAHQSQQRSVRCCTCARPAARLGCSEPACAWARACLAVPCTQVQLVPLQMLTLQPCDAHLPGPVSPARPLPWPTTPDHPPMQPPTRPPAHPPTHPPTCPSCERPTWCGSLPPVGASATATIWPKAGLWGSASTTNRASLHRELLAGPAQTNRYVWGGAGAGGAGAVAPSEVALAAAGL